jgi:hypothetical protein
MDGTNSIDWKVLDEYERANAETICRWFFPHGKKVGQEWKIGDVTGVPGESLGVQLTGDKAGLWHDRATGEGKGKKLRNLIAASHGISDQAAVDEIERAFGVSFSSNGHTPNPGPSVSEYWENARSVAKVNAGILASFRGFSVEFCKQIIDAGLIGMHCGKWCLPVYSDSGSLCSLQVREHSGDWRYRPSGQPATPFIVGSIKTAKTVHAFESNFDLLAALEKLGFPIQEEVAFLSTRGAANAKLVAQYAPANATVYAWVQNDAPGRKWLEDLGPVHAVRVPEKFKDINDWTRGGGTKAHLQASIDAAQKGTTEDRLFDELLTKYTKAVCTSEQLEGIDIPPRKFLVGQWMREGDSGFVFGERGSGKTWLIDAIATHVSTGRELHGWHVPESVNVLLVDGEMPIEDSRNRLKGMSAKNQNLHVLHHDKLFDDSGLAMNLTEPLQQRIITAICQSKKIKLLILDNLSCLFSGIKENDADAWELVLNWLLDLRRRKIAVLIVHHAGRSGFMRGTSKREDAAFWIIRVEEMQNRAETETGAHFQTSFTKQRNSTSREWTREWTFQTEENGEISISCKEISFEGKVLQLIQDGLTSASEICDELHVAKSTVSKTATKLLAKKLIELNGRQYRPRGFMKS